MIDFHFDGVGSISNLHEPNTLLGAGNKNLKMQAASRGSIWCSFSPAANQRSLPYKVIFRFFMPAPSTWPMALASSEQLRTCITTNRGIRSLSSSWLVDQHSDYYCYTGYIAVSIVIALLSNKVGLGWPTSLKRFNHRDIWTLIPMDYDKRDN
jgi:hypothetical protein